MDPGTSPVLFILPTIVISARLARKYGLREFAVQGFRTDDSVGRHAIL